MAIAARSGWPTAQSVLLFFARFFLFVFVYFVFQSDFVGIGFLAVGLVVLLSGPTVFVVALRSGCDGLPGLYARHYKCDDASARHSLDQPFLGCLGRRANQYCAIPFDFRVACPSGLSDERGDSANGLS